MLNDLTVSKNEAEMCGECIMFDMTLALEASVICGV